MFTDLDLATPIRQYVGEYTYYHSLDYRVSLTPSSLEQKGNHRLAPRGFVASSLTRYILAAYHHFTVGKLTISDRLCIVAALWPCYVDLASKHRGR